MIDDSPKPILYIALHDLRCVYNTNVFNGKEDKSEVNETKLFLQIMNFQIDNMQNVDMPVVLGPKNYYEKLLLDRDIARNGK